jgi:Asp-tRNA(Asn)/Glu-tRNA(Gln) amidotransferase C subunit
MKNIYKSEFSTINTEEKAYVLGYIYGDGCLYQQKSKRKNVSIQYRTTILSKDEEIIDKIKNCFNFFNKTVTKNKYYTLTAYNKELFDDLKKAGVYEKKSKENRNFLKIPKISEKLIPHFIRGLYDSDGGFYLYDTLIETFFCSTSLPFMLEIKNWFIKNNINVNFREVKKEGFLDMYWIRTKSNTSAKKFYDLIYKDSNIFMDRKMKVFLEGDMSEVSVKKSNYNSKIKSNNNQYNRLVRDYKKVLEKYKEIKEVENPSVCCNYHTIESGKSYKKQMVRPLFLCLNCGKRSVFNRVLLKQDELTGTP